MIDETLKAPVARKLRSAARALRDHGFSETPTFLEALAEKESAKVRVTQTTPRSSA